jgi:hypothetical protein
VPAAELVELGFKPVVGPIGFGLVLAVPRTGSVSKIHSDSF